MTELTDDYATWDAPYVLGSLTRVERREYEDHLASCVDCQAAVADLAGLPGMLALVDTETALAMIEPPAEVAAATESAPPVPQLLPRLAAAAERRHRRSRWVSIGTAVAAAAAAVAIAVPLAVTMTGTEEPGTSEHVFAERTMQPLQPTPVAASFKLIPAGDKTRVVMSCSYPPSAQSNNWNFAMYVTRTDGQQEELGQWPATPGTDLTVDQTVNGPPDQVRAVEIRSAGTGKVLLVGTV
ncbi:zf-HC2 domain-containing protein [Nocardia sp. NPDC049190]|uniref:anti-sigma factor family protein n=1 Tax=Nocardia sp. NPDC049190 TaxID=3155650 RepID=UPI0033D0FE9B